MKAIIYYQLTDEAVERCSIEKEVTVPKKQTFEFDTKEVEGTKEILAKIACLNLNEKTPKFERSIKEQQVDELLTKKNILQYLQKELEISERKKKEDELKEEFYKLTDIQLKDKKTTHCANCITVDNILKVYDAMSKEEIIRLVKIAKEIQSLIDKLNYNFTDCCINYQDKYFAEKFIINFFGKLNEAEEFLKEAKEKYKENLETRENERKRFIEDRVKRGFTQEEAEEIYSIKDRKERFEKEKEIWANKFGSKRLKEGIAQGYNMNRIYHEERYQKEYGDGTLTNEWYSEASNPTLEHLEKEKELKKKFPLDNILIVWVDEWENEREAIEINADWAKKYWILQE